MNIPVSQYRQLLARYLAPLRRSMLALAFLLFSNLALQLVNPQIMRRFIDSALSGVEVSILLPLAGLFLLIALVQQVVTVLSTYVSENVAWSATNTLRGELASHCLRLDLSFHNAHTPGEMIERLDGDVTTLADFFSRFVIELVGNGLLLVGVSALLFREDWRIGLAITIFILATLFVLARFRNVAVPYWDAERQANADLFGFLEERLQGTEDIRANGAQAYVLRRFFELMRTQLQKALRAGMMGNLLLNAALLLFAAGNAVALAVGAYLFIKGEISIGTVYLIFSYTNTIQRPIEDLSHQMTHLQRAGAGIVRTQKLFAMNSRIQEPGGDASPFGSPSAASMPGAAIQVDFERVTFAYHDQPAPVEPAEPALLAASSNRTDKAEESPAVQTETVLHDLTFHLPAGVVLGLLGRTGSGKTSLTRLLFRLYDPDQGVIYLANTGAGALRRDLRQLPLDDLRSQVGMIPQNIQLFNASVRDNLTFFNPDIPDSRIEQALQSLELGDWLHSLPQGLDTELQAGGSGLSAGEAQLLAFARIFLKNPGLVILDEASSRLDPATSQRIERAVDRLVQGRTAIIVAHRLATVQRADQIMILEGGRILEFGPRLQLAGDPGSHFARLLQTGLEDVLV